MISDNIKHIRQTIPNGVKLLCVSKFHPVESILDAYEIGERCFGESRVQELILKHKLLPKDIEWHFIGHLQTNKIKQIIPLVHLIHGVDSVHLLHEINKEAQKQDRIVNLLLEVHVAQEMTKYGFGKEQLVEWIKTQEWKDLKNVRICGIMGMATQTDDEQQIKSEFNQLKELFDILKENEFSACNYFSTLSMGMTDDYLIAIGCGSNLVRIGTAIFGERI